MLTFPQDDESIDFIDELGRSKPTRRSRIPKILGVRSGGFSHVSRLTRTLQGEKVIFFYNDDGKLAAGPESQIPPHLLPEDPDEYVTKFLLQQNLPIIFHLTQPRRNLCAISNRPHI